MSTRYTGAPSPLSDEEIEEWIGHDEGLYDAQAASGQSMAAFIAENRDQLVLYINAVRTNMRPAHFWKYGP